MKKIELTQGQYAIVDDEYFDEINQYNWYSNKGYAVRHVTVSGKRTKQLMHRLITNCPDDMEVDHINHDKLDNQKSNLRVCSTSENQHNQQMRTKAKTSSYKGVCFDKHAGKWRARIGLNNEYKFLGLFENEIDAAIAYNNAAIELFGEFAFLNEV